MVPFSFLGVGPAWSVHERLGGIGFSESKQTDPFSPLNSPTKLAKIFKTNKKHMGPTTNGSHHKWVPPNKWVPPRPPTGSKLAGGEVDLHRGRVAVPARGGGVTPWNSVHGEGGCEPMP